MPCNFFSPPVSTSQAPSRQPLTGAVPFVRCADISPHRGESPSSEGAKEKSSNREGADSKSQHLPFPPSDEGGGKTARSDVLTEGEIQKRKVYRISPPVTVSFLHRDSPLVRGGKGCVLTSAAPQTAKHPQCPVLWTLGVLYCCLPAQMRPKRTNRFCARVRHHAKPVFHPKPLVFIKMTKYSVLCDSRTTARHRSLGSGCFFRNSSPVIR